MGIFDRLSNILKSKKSSEQEQTQDPEKAFDKMIEGIDKAIEEARTYVAEFTSIENKLYQEKTAALQKAKGFQAQVERAVLTGRDDLAQEAMLKKQEYENIAAEYQRQITAQESVSNQVKEQLQTLTNKRTEAKHNRDLLLTRQRSLEIQQKMNQAVQGPSGNLFSEMDHLEQSLRQAEALAEAQAELNGLSKTPSNKLASNLPSPSTLNVSGIDELSVLESKAKAQDQLKEIRSRFEPPKTDLWFNEEPKTPLKPENKKDIWFNEEPKTPTKIENKPENKKDLWFDESPKPTNKETSNKETPKQIWFDESANQVNKTNQTTQTKDVWFDEPTKNISRANINLPNQTSLVSGANTSLSKIVSPLSKLSIHLGWEISNSFKTIELNSCCLLATSTGKVRSETDFIYYNNPSSSCGAVKHLGEDTSLQDNEIIEIDFTKLSPEITKIVFSVIIYEGESRKQTFQNIPSVWLRVLNVGTELATFLYTNRGLETVLILGEIYLHKSEWKFRALGQGFAAGLVALLNSYGVEVN
ncbi:MAG: TerD family protein [Blastocatellia bacterium]|nr:TerD family protein [Blastocatellia bacterium]MBN8725121.1 TerD family protein [Acidobacteriota bacterium]